MPIHPRDFLLPETPLVNLAELSDTEVAYDVAVLTHFLEHGYGGRKYFSPEPLQTVLADLRRLGPAHSEELCREIDELLYRLPDNHLLATSQGRVVYKTRLNTRERKGVVGENIQPHSARLPWHVGTVPIQGTRHKVLVIAINSFPLGEEPVWKGFLDSVNAQLQQAAAVIIDYRKNSGGDDSTGFALAELLLGTPVPSITENHWISSTPESAVLMANRFKKMERNRSKNGLDPSPALQARYQEMLKTLEGAELMPPVEFRVESENEPRPIRGHDLGPGFRGPVYVLMDYQTGSSGESAIQALGQQPLLFHVGEHTHGVLQFGDQGLLVLPRSGIEIGMPTTYNQYAGGNFYERVGIMPDIPVPPGQDAFNVALRHLAKSIETSNRK